MTECACARLGSAAAAQALDWLPSCVQPVCIDWCNNKLFKVSDEDHAAAEIDWLMDAHCGPPALAPPSNARLPGFADDKA